MLDILWINMILFRGELQDPSVCGVDLISAGDSSKVQLYSPYFNDHLSRSFVDDEV